MGKRGDGRRRRKEQAARSVAQFSERSRLAYVNDSLLYEENKRAQSEYLKRVPRLKRAFSVGLCTSFRRKTCGEMRISGPYDRF
jgi:hypothetical protein